MTFDRFMAMALYTPGLGYYAHGSRKFGLMPQSGSDFVTAPELSPRFGQTLARQVTQALQATGTAEIWEFGAGSGALALQMLDALGPLCERYTYVFEGNSQALDHILISQALVDAGYEYDVVHVNAEFADQVSDHDPQVVRLRPRARRPS